MRMNGCIPSPTLRSRSAVAPQASQPCDAPQGSATDYEVAMCRRVGRQRIFVGCMALSRSSNANNGLSTISSATFSAASEPNVPRGTRGKWHEGCLVSGRASIASPSSVSGRTQRPGNPGDHVPYRPGAGTIAAGIAMDREPRQRPRCWPCIQRAYFASVCSLGVAYAHGRMTPARIESFRLRRHSFRFRHDPV